MSSSYDPYARSRPSDDAAARALAGSLDAMATTRASVPRCIDGTTIRTAMSAAPSTPHFTGAMVKASPLEERDAIEVWRNWFGQRCERTLHHVDGATRD